MSAAPARRPPVRRRSTVRGIALPTVALLALAPLLAACSAHSVPTTDMSVGAQQVISKPGSLTVLPAHNDPDAPDLQITGAILVPGPDGNEELRLTVNNAGAAPEHLYAARCGAAKAVGLFVTPAAGAAPQAAGDSGIPLNAATTTTFGPGGPRILLEAPKLPAAGTITVTLFFSVAGILHLTVAVPSGTNATNTTLGDSATP